MLQRERLKLPTAVREYNMIMSPVRLGTKKHCAGEGQHQFSSQSVNYRTKRVVTQLRKSWYSGTNNDSAGEDQQQFTTLYQKSYAVLCNIALWYMTSIP
jgi:hypothetical protein